MAKRKRYKQRKPLPIRITKNDRAEYTKLAKSAKAKIGRTLKRYGETVVFTGEDGSTETVKVRDLIDIPKLENFKSRKEFNKWKEQARSFTNRNNMRYQFKKNKFDVVATKATINKIERETKRAQNIAKDIINEAQERPFVSGGKAQGTVGQRMLQMGKPNAGGIYMPDDFDFNKYKNPKSVEKRAKNIEKRSDPSYYNTRTEKMKDTYLEQLQQVFNSDADDLVRKLKNMPSDDFYQMYLMFDEFDFDWFYDPEEGEKRLNTMMPYVERYERGDFDTDLNLQGF